MGATKIIVVEDDTRFRAAFADVLNSAPDCQLVGCAADVVSGRRLLRESQPDVALIDLGLPGGSGLELVREAPSLAPGCDVVVVTVFADEVSVMAAICAGATGYWLKDAGPAALLEQIRTVRAGGSPISPVVARQLLKRMRQVRAVNEVAATDEGGAGKLSQQDELGAPKPAAGELSQKEMQVLELAEKGFTHDEIAVMLAVSRNTVLTFVKRCYRKLQVHSKAEAVYEARRLGILRD